MRLTIPAMYKVYMRKYDFPCHDDVIIRLDEDDVIVDLGNVVARCLNDVILNDRQLKSCLINAYFIHRVTSTRCPISVAYDSGSRSPGFETRLCHLVFPLGKEIESALLGGRVSWECPLGRAFTTVRP